MADKLYVNEDGSLQQLDLAPAPEFVQRIEALEQQNTAQSAKDAAQDAAISAAQSSADEKVSALDGTLRGLIEAEKSVLQGQIQNAVPTGTIIPHAGNKDLNGYLLCNGAAVSRTTYAALFSAIGTIYGAGDGSTTFNIPNMDGRVIQGTTGAPQYREAGLPNIAGGTAITGGNVLQIDGAWGSLYAFTKGYAVTSIQGSSANDRPITLGLDASRSSSVYGKSPTVQPPALAMRCYIKY